MAPHQRKFLEPPRRICGTMFPSWNGESSVKCGLVSAFIFAVLGTGMALGQAVIPPPTPQYPVFGPTGALPSLNLTFVFNKGFAEDPEPARGGSWNIGVRLAVIRTPKFLLEVEGSECFRAPAFPATEYQDYHPFFSLVAPPRYFVAQSSSSGPIGWIALGDLSLGIGVSSGYHEVRQPVGMLKVTDLAFAVSLTHAPIVLSWGARNSTIVWARINTSYSAPTQGPARGPDRLQLDGMCHVELVRIGRLATLFVEGGAACTFRDSQGAIPATTPLNLDYHLRSGIHLPNAVRGISAYVQFERVTDPWDTIQPRLLHSLSAGATVVFAVGAIQ